MEKLSKTFSVNLILLFLCSALLIIVSCSQEEISTEEDVQKRTEAVRYPDKYPIKYPEPVRPFIECVVTHDNQTGVVYDEDDINQNTNSFYEPSPIIIKVKFNFIRRSDGTGGAAEADMTTIINNLNSVFNVHISGIVSTLVDVKRIQFTNAGNDTLNSDTYFEIDNPTEYNALLQNTDLYEANMLNIYLVGSLYLANGNAGGAAGIMDNRATIITEDNRHLEASTVSHEVGHSLGLYHTHKEDFGLECADFSNGYTTGDLVIDTPADITFLPTTNIENCVYTVDPTFADLCDNTPYDPSLQNIMSYYGSCRTGFSVVQHMKMNANAITLGITCEGGGNSSSSF
ncbi:zinc-dependent metalloprotease family protein [Kordia algicida OT-1]|uniref:Peptidase M43 pregnancy-associated plasma-A domain-containing protein n=1 Tax=Kordia algicida OT-1 TaxID=391587 RepID=A9DX42_9FLAO|nr:zinc-dependent metalloprotease family protein [Kordia algicida]EDP95958.1 hypothetical protein KAOT1_07313 [Kordia algicida OT-1]